MLYGGRFLLVEAECSEALVEHACTQWTFHEPSVGRRPVHACRLIAHLDAVRLVRPCMAEIRYVRHAEETTLLRREQHSRPIKQPLRSLTVVHPDNSFLQDLSGEQLTAHSWHVD